MCDLASLWKVHIFLLLAVYQTAVFRLMDSEMGFIICQLVSRCSGDSQTDQKDELNSSTNVGGQPLQTISLSCSGPSIFLLLSVIKCPAESYSWREKPPSCVCVCTICFYLVRHSPVQDKKKVKTASVLKCLWCKPIFGAIRESNI